MAYVEHVTFSHEREPSPIYGREGFRGFGRERQSAKVVIEIACTRAEATLLYERIRAGMGFDVERGGVDDGERPELPAGRALPPGPIDAELLNDEEPRRGRR